MERQSTITPRDLERMLLDKTAEPKALPLSLLEEITDGFSDEQKIGSGAFAVVYKGKLENWTVAVKRMSNTYMYEKEFQREVECLMIVKHKNVVRFLGYCADTQGSMERHDGKFVMADVQERLLCFEYLSKGNLHEHVTDTSHRLRWKDCYKVITGICQGLHYLHHKNILHLDLKPANILLDDNWLPKIADFGISRCFGQMQSQVISNIAGTVGYLAPESFNHTEVTYRNSYQLDIYSLGVVIIEILTGKKGYHDVDKVVKSWSGMLEESQREVQLEQVRVCAEIGIECTNFNPAKRPDTENIISRFSETESMGVYTEAGVITSQQIPAVMTKALPGFLSRAPSSGRTPFDQNQPPRYKLMFRNGLSKDVFTKREICAANGDPLKICLVRNQEGNSSCRLLSAKINIVVLNGDFNRDSEDCWTSEYFRTHIVRRRYNVQGLLKGELELTLKNGEADLHKAHFIDHSKFVRSGMFRLGVMIADVLGERVQEGITEPFTVKDRRGRREAYQKHIIPSLYDEVWRLKKISKNGVFHKSLQSCRIFSVRDFLRSYYKDEPILRKVLPSATKLVWTTMVDHAKMCDPGEELYSFFLQGCNVVLFFSSLYQIIGATTGDQYTPFSDFDKPMQDLVEEWREFAYETFPYREPDYQMDNGKPRPVSQKRKFHETDDDQSI